ncbi:MAG TPA: arsenite methyltransferase [Dehalococcoidia bacterium]|nr:arsenite methyltransferase [Dehalococcoidia bacterium]
MTTDAETIRDAVRGAYGERAREVLSGAPGDRAGGVASKLYAEADSLPAGVVSYGCGNPVAIAQLQAGETVLDLGSGAGLDCFLAARQVGPSGRVIGVDMTDDMLTLAETNRARLLAAGDHVANVEFRRGLIEAIPLDDAAVDVIISNCVINLSTDKDAVFSEAFRVLRPGGRFQVSDVVLLREISNEERADLDLWSGCKSGALHLDDYRSRLAAAGFEDVEIAVEANPTDAWASALINARRPGGGAPRRGWQFSGPTIELLAPAGLDTADCCSLDDPSCC